MNEHTIIEKMKDTYGNDCIKELRHMFFNKLKESYHLSDAMTTSLSNFTVDVCLNEMDDVFNLGVLMFLSNSFAEINTITTRLNSNGNLTRDQASSIYIDSIKEMQKKLCKINCFKSHFKDGEACLTTLEVINENPKPVLENVKELQINSKGPYEEILRIRELERNKLIGKDILRYRAFIKNTPLIHKYLKGWGS